METDFDTVAKSLPNHIRRSLVDDPIQLDPVTASHVDVPSRMLNSDAERLSSVDRAWHNKESVMRYPMNSQGAMNLVQGPLTQISGVYTRNQKESEDERQLFWQQKEEEGKLERQIKTSLDAMEDGEVFEEKETISTKEKSEKELYQMLRTFPYVQPETKLPETQYPLKEVSLRDVSSTVNGAYSDGKNGLIHIDDESSSVGGEDKKVANYLNTLYARNRDRENALERSLAHSKAASGKWLEGLGKLAEETSRMHEAHRCVREQQGQDLRKTAKSLVPAGQGAVQAVGLGSSMYVGNVGIQVQKKVPEASFSVGGQFLANSVRNGPTDLVSRLTSEEPESTYTDVHSMNYAVMEAWTAQMQGKNVLKVDGWNQMETDQLAFTTAAKNALALHSSENVDDKPPSRVARPRTQDLNASKDCNISSLDLIKAQSIVQVQLALQRRKIKYENNANSNNNNNNMSSLDGESISNSSLFEEEEVLRKKLLLSGFTFSTSRNRSQNVTLTKQLPYNQFSQYDSSTGSVKQTQYNQEIKILEEAQAVIDEQPNLVQQNQIIKRVPTGQAAPVGLTSNAYRSSRAEERRRNTAAEKKRREEDPDAQPDLAPSPKHEELEELVEMQSARLYGDQKFGEDHLDLLVQQQGPAPRVEGKVYTYNPLANKTFILDVAPPPRPPLDPKDAKRLAMQKRMGSGGMGGNGRKKELPPLPVLIPKFKSEMLAEPLRPVLVAASIAHHTLQPAPKRLGEVSVDVGNHKTTVKLLNPTMQAAVNSQDTEALKARAGRAQALVEAEKIKLALAQNKVSVTSHALEQAYTIPIPTLSKQEKMLFATSMNALVVDPQVIKVKKVKRRVKK